MLIELAVKFDESHTPADLERLLNTEKGIEKSEINVKAETVIIESSCPVSKLLSTFNSAGFPALFRGVSSQAKSMQECDFGSGVAPLTSEDCVYGLCRLFQPSDDYVLVDATMAKLTPKQTVTLVIHKYGDLSSSSYSCGDVYTNDTSTGDLGEAVADDQGQATLLVEKQGLRLCDLIGRSVVLHDTLTKTRLACGVIARSAILSQNNKRVCACSGKTLWEERVDSPFA